jgi:hypothetical protein
VALNSFIGMDSASIVVQEVTEVGIVSEILIERGRGQQGGGGEGRRKKKKKKKKMVMMMMIHLPLRCSHFTILIIMERHSRQCVGELQHCSGMYGEILIETVQKKVMDFFRK